MYDSVDPGARIGVSVPKEPAAGTPKPATICSANGRRRMFSALHFQTGD